MSGRLGPWNSPFKRIRTVVVRLLLLAGLLTQWRWLMVQFRPTKLGDDAGSGASKPERETNTSVDGSIRHNSHAPASGNDGSNCSILNDACLDQIAASIRRVWQRKSIETWCNVHTTGNTSGLLRLIKVPKSASSTAAGVVLRIQTVHNCVVQWEHGRAADVVPHSFHSTLSNEQLRVSPRRQSWFLLAPVRTPHSRALSVVYYNQISFHRRQRSNQPKTPADAFILKHLQQIPPNSISDYMHFTLPESSASVSQTVSRYDNLTTATDVRNYVQDIVDAYDFLLVASRMDESLVVLSLLTNVPLTSILTLSSKATGSWYLTRHTKANTSSLQYQCIRLVPPVSTPAIQAYFESDSWKARHAADRLLFATANQSLDATIAIFPTFRRHYEMFQQWQRLVQSQCSANNDTQFPCSRTGVPQLEQSKRSCYERDFGCGYPCIDRVVKENGNL